MHAVFFDADREMLHTSFMCRFKDLTCQFFFLFLGSEFSPVKIFWKIWITLNQTFLPENRKHPKVKPRDGHVEYVCNISGSKSQKRHGQLDFCA